MKSKLTKPSKPAKKSNNSSLTTNYSQNPQNQLLTDEFSTSMLSYISQYQLLLQQAKTTQTTSKMDQLKATMNTTREKFEARNLPFPATVKTKILDLKKLRDAYEAKNEQISDQIRSHETTSGSGISNQNRNYQNSSFRTAVESMQNRSFVEKNQADNQVFTPKKTVSGSLAAYNGNCGQNPVLKEELKRPVSGRVQEQKSDDKTVLIDKQVARQSYYNQQPSFSQVKQRPASGATYIQASGPSYKNVTTSSQYGQISTGVYSQPKQVSPIEKIQVRQSQYNQEQRGQSNASVSSSQEKIVENNLTGYTQQEQFVIKKDQEKLQQYGTFDRKQRETTISQTKQRPASGRAPYTEKSGASYQITSSGTSGAKYPNQTQQRKVEIKADVNNKLKQATPTEKIQYTFYEKYVIEHYSEQLQKMKENSSNFTEKQVMAALYDNYGDVKRSNALLAKQLNQKQENLWNEQPKVRRIDNYRSGQIEQIDQFNAFKDQELKQLSEKVALKQQLDQCQQILNLNLGYSKEQITQALTLYGGDIDQALNSLIENQLQIAPKDKNSLSTVQTHNNTQINLDSRIIPNSQQNSDQFHSTVQIQPIITKQSPHAAILNTTQNNKIPQQQPENKTFTPEIHSKFPIANSHLAKNESEIGSNEKAGCNPINSSPLVSAKDQEFTSTEKFFANLYPQQSQTHQMNANYYQNASNYASNYQNTQFSKQLQEIQNLGMGFSDEQILAALVKSAGDCEKATDLLLNVGNTVQRNGNQQYIIPQSQGIKQSRILTAKEQLLVKIQFSRQLQEIKDMDMGFSDGQILAALNQSAGDCEETVDLLLNDENGVKRGGSYQQNLTAKEKLLLKKQMEQEQDQSYQQGLQSQARQQDIQYTVQKQQPQNLGKQQEQEFTSTERYYANLYQKQFLQLKQIYSLDFTDREILKALQESNGNFDRASAKLQGSLQPILPVQQPVAAPFLENKTADVEDNEELTKVMAGTKGSDIDFKRKQYAKPMIDVAKTEDNKIADIKAEEIARQEGKILWDDQPVVTQLSEFYQKMMEKYTQQYYQIHDLLPDFTPQKILSALINNYGIVDWAIDNLMANQSEVFQPSRIVQQQVRNEYEPSNLYAYHKEYLEQYRRKFYQIKDMKLPNKDGDILFALDLYKGDVQKAVDQLLGNSIDQKESQNDQILANSGSTSMQKVLIKKQPEKPYLESKIDQESQKQQSGMYVDMMKQGEFEQPNLIHCDVQKVQKVVSVLQNSVVQQQSEQTAYRQNCSILSQLNSENDQVSANFATSQQNTQNLSNNSSQRQENYELQKNDRTEQSYLPANKQAAELLTNQNQAELSNQPPLESTFSSNKDSKQSLNQPSKQPDFLDQQNVEEKLIYEQNLANSQQKVSIVEQRDKDQMESLSQSYENDKVKQVQQQKQLSKQYNSIITENTLSANEIVEQMKIQNDVKNHIEKQNSSVQDEQNQYLSKEEIDIHQEISKPPNNEICKSQLQQQTQPPQTSITTRNQIQNDKLINENENTEKYPKISEFPQDTSDNLNEKPAILCKNKQLLPVKLDQNDEVTQNIYFAEEMNQEFSKEQIISKGNDKQAIDQHLISIDDQNSPQVDTITAIIPKTKNNDFVDDKQDVSIKNRELTENQKQIDKKILNYDDKQLDKQNTSSKNHSKLVISENNNIIQNDFQNNQKLAEKTENSPKFIQNSLQKDPDCKQFIVTKELVNQIEIIQLPNTNQNCDQNQQNDQNTTILAQIQTIHNDKPIIKSFNNTKSTLDQNLSESKNNSNSNIEIIQKQQNSKNDDIIPKQQDKNTEKQQQPNSSITHTIDSKINPQQQQISPAQQLIIDSFTDNILSQIDQCKNLKISINRSLQLDKLLKIFNQTITTFNSSNLQPPAYLQKRINDFLLQAEKQTAQIITPNTLNQIISTYIPPLQTGLENNFANCFANTAIQSLLAISAFRSLLFSDYFSALNNSILEHLRGVLSSKKQIFADKFNDNLAIFNMSKFEQSDSAELVLGVLSAVNDAETGVKGLPETNETTAIQQIFGCVLENKTECRNCGKVKISEEITRCQFLPVLKSLEKSFQRSCEEVEVEGFECEQCSGKSIFKSQNFVKAGRCVVFQLERWGVTGEKCCGSIQIEEKIDFSDGVSHQLKAVICHQGNSEMCGHFYCYVFVDGEWEVRNDEVVRSVEFGEICLSEVYMLIYEQEEVVVNVVRQKKQIFSYKRAVSTDKDDKFLKQVDLGQKVGNGVLDIQKEVSSGQRNFDQNQKQPESNKFEKKIVGFQGMRSASIDTYDQKNHQAAQQPIKQPMNTDQQHKSYNQCLNYSGKSQQPSQISAQPVLQQYSMKASTYQQTAQSQAPVQALVAAPIVQKQYEKSLFDGQKKKPHQSYLVDQFGPQCRQIKQMCTDFTDNQILYALNYCHGNVEHAINSLFEMSKYDLQQNK